jgi:hypothetical protein
MTLIMVYLMTLLVARMVLNKELAVNVEGSGHGLI